MADNFFGAKYAKVTDVWLGTQFAGLPIVQGSLADNAAAVSGTITGYSFTLKDTNRTMTIRESALTGVITTP